MTNPRWKEDILSELSEDHVGLWEVVNALRAENKELSPDDLRTRGIKAVAELLATPDIEPGFPTNGGGFDPWSLSTEEALDRIENEWLALGRDPNIGEIVWFNKR